MIEKFNQQKYRVCLDKYLDINGECYAYGIELGITDGKDGFVVDSMKSLVSEGADLDNNYGIEIIILKYFNDLNEAEFFFNSYCKDYSIP